MKEAISRKKDAHKAMCRSSTEENKNMYETRTKKVVSEEMRVKAEDVLTELNCLDCLTGMFRLVTGLRIGSNKVHGVRCMRGSDGRLCFAEKERGKVWKDCMTRIMNEENKWGS